MTRMISRPKTSSWKTGKTDEHLWSDGDNDRPDDGTCEAAEATDHNNGELQDEFGEIERHRREMADRDREHRSADPDDCATPGKCQDDVAVRGDAHGRCGNFVVLDCQESAAEARAQQLVGGGDDQHGKDEKGVEPASVAGERPAEQAGGGHRHAHRTACQRFPSDISPAHQLAERQGHDSQIEQPHAAQCGDAGNCAGGATHHRRRNDGQPPRTPSDAIRTPQV